MMILQLLVNLKCYQNLNVIRNGCKIGMARQGYVLRGSLGFTPAWLSSFAPHSLGSSGLCTCSTLTSLAILMEPRISILSWGESQYSSVKSIGSMSRSTR